MNNKKMIKDMILNLRKLALLRMMTKKYADNFSQSNDTMRNYYEQTECMADDDMTGIVAEDRENDLRFLRQAGDFHRAINAFISSKSDVLYGLLKENAMDVEDLEDDDEDGDIDYESDLTDLLSQMIANQESAKLFNEIYFSDLDDEDYLHLIQNQTGKHQCFMHQINILLYLLEKVTGTDHREALLSKINARLRTISANYEPMLSSEDE